MKDRNAIEHGTLQVFAADEIIPQLLELAPWLDRHACPITGMPLI